MNFSHTFQDFFANIYKHKSCHLLSIMYMTWKYYPAQQAVCIDFHAEVHKNTQVIFMPSLICHDNHRRIPKVIIWRGVA